MDEVEVCLVKIPQQLEKSLLSELLSRVTREKQAKIKGFVKPQDGVRALAAELLVRFLIGRQLELANDQIVFGVNEYGKPFLKNNPDLHFNLSHSGDWVACGLAPVAVGVDVQRIKSVNPGVARRFFSDQESQWLREQPKTARTYCFFKLWTLKESYVKAIGTGFHTPLESFTITIDSTGVQPLSCDSTEYFFKEYAFDGEYQLAVCSTMQRFAKAVQVVPWEAMITNFTLGNYNSES